MKMGRIGPAPPLDQPDWGSLAAGCCSLPRLDDRFKLASKPLAFDLCFYGLLTSTNAGWG
jgi:hypothetical protein